MATLITGILDFMRTQVVAITPTFAGPPFAASVGDEPLSLGPTDTGADRTVRVVTMEDRALRKLWGAGANEYERTVQVLVKHIMLQSDTEMEQRMDADEQDITIALQATGLSWPAGLVNVVPATGGARTPLTGEGADVMLQSVPFTVIYEEY